MKSTKPSSLRERFNISRLAIAHPRLTVSFWLAIAVAGIFAFSSLKYALLPDITFPIVVVNAQVPKMTALETEKNLTRPIEAQMQSLSGLDRVRAWIYPAQTLINLGFAVGTDLNAAAERVEEGLTRVDLPPETSLETIKINLNESPVISYAIESDSYSLRELTKIASEQIIPPITRLPGVGKVNLLGDATDLTTPSFVRFNGANALGFQVIKESDGNALAVVREVEAAVKKLQLPGVKLTLAQTEADYIKDATQATIDALLQAIVLAVLVIFPFLRNWRATLIAALAIPISLLGTSIVMAMAGFNLETITLLALAIVIGIIIDDAIVDVENISRYVEAGKSPKEAAILGTDEIGLTVTASTLTIAAVFLPVAFMPGVVGQFFQPFGLTVSAAVLISLLEARTLSPVLAVWFLKEKRGTGRERVSSSGGKVAEYYRRLLAWSLDDRGIVVLIAIISFIAGIALIPFIPQGFIPKLDRGEFNIVYTTPLPKLPSSFKETETETRSSAANAPGDDGTFSWLEELATPTRLLLRKTRKVGQELEAVVLNFPEVESTFTIAGVRGEFNKGRIYVKLKDNRQLHTQDVQTPIRKRLPQLPGVKTSVEDIQFVAQAEEKPLQLALIGEDLQQLQQIATQLKSQIEQIRGVVDVTATGEDNVGDKILAIEHLNGKRVVKVTGNLTGEQAIGDVTEQAIALAKAILPPDITLDLEGDSAQIGIVVRSFAITLAISVTLMLLFLILPFGRLLEPLVVGATLPLSIVGAMVALLITQSYFGIISLIGFIFLLGLLDKNALLLMDYINQLRKSGMSRRSAILTTGTVRLRPILMTTASSILAMVPIALGIGRGAELRQPMAVAIIGGLITSTLLSAIAVPVFYTLLEDGWLKITEKLGWNYRGAQEDTDRTI